jgi:hypothetical protein
MQYGGNRLINSSIMQQPLTVANRDMEVWSSRRVQSRVLYCFDRTYPTTVNLMKNYKTVFLYLLIFLSGFGILGLSRLHVSAGHCVAEMISLYKSAANGSKLYQYTEQVAPAFVDREF